MLVLTAPVDPTADVVIQHLTAAGVPFARCDAAQFPMEISLTATLDAEVMARMSRRRPPRRASLRLLPTAPAVRVRSGHSY